MGYTIPNQVLPCPTTTTLRYTFRQEVHKCPPASFKPFVDATRAGVDDYVLLLRCQNPCNRFPKSTIKRTAWLCHQPPTRLEYDVEVTIYFEVSCQP
jgi:hypothetical protein